MKGESRRTAWHAAALVLVLGASALLAWKLGWFDYSRMGALARRLRSLHDPLLAAVIFLAIWAIAASIGFPALPMMLVGGVLFGMLLGTALNLVGTALGATGGYVFARTVGHGLLQRWLARHLPTHELSRRRDFLAIARFRLLPVIPFAVGNFAAGLARMDFWPYLAGTLAGQLPSTLIYTYFADAMVKAAARGSPTAAGKDAAIASGCMLVLSLIPRIVQRMHRNGG